MRDKFTIQSIFFTIIIIINLFFLIDIPLLFVNKGIFSLSINNDNWHDFLSHQVRFMQNSLFFYGLTYLLIKNIKIRHILYLTPLAYLEVQYSLFAQYIHPLLLNIGIYSLFSDNPYNVSPEYPRVIFFFIIFIAFIGLLFFKRAFKTIFLCISMGAILTTSILFHTLSINSLDFYTDEQESSIKQMLQMNNKNDIYNQCNFSHFNCFVIESDKNIFNAINNSKHLNSNLVNIVAQYQGDIEPYYNQSVNYFYYTVSNDNSIKDRINSRKPIAFLKNEHMSFIVLDDNNYTKYLKLKQLHFEILSFFSHFIWILGILYLIYFHEKRKKSGLNTKNTVQ